MENFVFHNPTKVLFGRGTLGAVGPETAALGRRALLVYGRESLKNNGIHEQITASLSRAGVDWREHGGVRPNPVVSHVRAGIALARAHRAEVIVAVGGGSVIDTAKAIAAGSVVEHDVWKFFLGKRGIRHPLPVVAIPTLAASGSELSGGMVLTCEERREKLGFGHRLLHPATSILDPETTFTVPPAHTVYGAVDALGHVLEFYLSATVGAPVSMRLMEGLTDSIMTACVRCLADPRDYDARATLMWAAALALSGLTTAGLGRVAFPVHLIEHSLSALYDIPHGAGLAVVMLGWLRAHEAEAAPRLAALGTRLFPASDLPEDMPAAAQRTIGQLHAWLAAVGAPLCLEDLAVPAADIPAIAANTRSQARLWRLSDYTPDRVEAILRCCLA